MRSSILITAAALALATPAFAESHGGGYSASDLMEPCQLADNDSRDGAPAETECEQYIMGFVEALEITGMAGPGTETCPPEVNTADEVRWAYIRWIYGDFTARKQLPANEAVMATLKDVFPCGS